MATGTYRDTLRQPGVWAFLWTQFLGAFNDNVFKIIVSFYAIRQLGEVNGITLAGAVFILPFLLFSGYAGHIADVWSKRSVLIWTKALEIVSMLLAVPAMLFGSVEWLLVVLGLMATQATFFSPAKYGIVPEMVPDAELSRANGLLEMSTFVAIVLGTTVGGELFQRLSDRPGWMAAILVGIAVVGSLTSLGIARVPAAQSTKPFLWDPFREIFRGIARMYPDRTLWMTMIGISYFWFLGALLQLALIPFGLDALHAGEAASTRLYTWLAIGIGAGSLAAGRLSGDKVELGLVPIGAFGMGLLSLVLTAVVPSYTGACVTLVFLGIAGGFFAVPLNALLQQRPVQDEKGRVIATNNFMNMVGVLVASAALFALSRWAGLTIRQIFIAAGVFTLLSSVYVLAMLPDFFVRFSLWLLTHTVYRIKIVGRPNIPTRGPALLICNHISVIDGALVGACIQRFVRFIALEHYFRTPVLGLLMRRMRAIPISPGNKPGVIEAVKRAHDELAAGHVVCIFAEGAVSRTGNLLPFKHGFERILQGLDVPVIPVYLDRVWGSIFSFKRGRFFWKLPEHLPYPVTVAFGHPLPSTVTATDARLAIMELGSEAMRHRRRRSDLLHIGFMRVAKRQWRRFAMADSTGQTLSYGRALVGAMLLGRVIANHTRGQSMVGLMLPASVGGALSNIATLFAGRIPVNLNFTAGPASIDAAITQCEIKTILTSKVFLKKASLPELPGMVFLEDLRKDISGLQKIAALVRARLVPTFWLRRGNGGRGLTGDSLATIIFSSGSTGVPKGVMISHANVLANVDGMAQVFPVGRDDCFIGVLPFFHSFGFTGTLWFPLLMGSHAAYHPNPMDAKTVGELAGAYQATMLIATPTFANAYVRRCTKEQFARIKYAVVGAEKLREPLAKAFREQFGVGLLEGYGCTEMAPVVAVNRPNVEHERERQIGTKAGSVGHPIPGVSAMVVDQNTGEGPLFDREGLLLVKGPNLMQGYFKQPELTKEVIRDGWYVTGDIAKVDEDGFIFITDRLSRFSKIGGEMVPHIKVEDTINEILGDACSAVTAIPDEAKGERLVAFYTRADVTPEALWAQLAETDLPKLWLPRRDGLIQIDAIPTLGTGKTDLRRLKHMALERAGLVTS